MRTFARLLIALAVVSTSLAAHATPIKLSYDFELSGVVLCSVTTAPCPSIDVVVGTLTGTITTDSNFTHILAADIVSKVGPTTVTYTLADSTLVQNQMPANFRLTTTGTNNQLQIVFTGGLKAGGASITTGSSSFDHEPANLYIEAGSFIPIPEPSTIALFSTGMVSCFGLARRRRWLPKA